MTPLGEMEQNNEQSNEQSKNMTRTNKNEQINASSESLGILSFIKNLFNKKLNCVLRNHVIYSGPVPSVIQDDLELFIQSTQYTVYINLHLKRCNQLLESSSLISKQKTSCSTIYDRLKEILVRGSRPSGSWSPENNTNQLIVQLVFLDIVRYTVLIVQRW